MTAQNLTILVNTSDSFEDCWHPFFTLFARFWPGCTAPIVLNTEHKAYQHDGLSVRSSMVAAGSPRRLTWSECLARCLDAIDTPYVLYLQEDFFLEAPVRVAEFDMMLDHLVQGRADVIRLTECEGSGPWSPGPSADLWRISADSKYFIALQAALWRKDLLRQWLRAHESPWQLEIFGSPRAARTKALMCCVNRDQYSGPGREIFPYTPTGIIRGQWAEDIVVDLFQREQIEVDFSRRGFYRHGAMARPKAPAWKRIADRARSLI